jgi:NADH-quinone oxidoreductase subunit G
MVRVQFIDDDDGTLLSEVDVKDGTRITEAATKAGVYIPTLCHHPRLNPIGSCGLCVCSVEKGHAPTQLSCSTLCHENENDGDSPMRVHLRGTYLNGLSNAAMRRSLENSMIYRKYETNNEFASCGSLEIEDLGNYLKKVNIDKSSCSITYEPSLCVGCSRCVRACGSQLQDMNVLEMPMPVPHPASVGIAQAPPCMSTKNGRPLKQTDCISCGQCTLFCPSGALKEVDHTSRYVLFI